MVAGGHPCRGRPLPSHRAPGRAALRNARPADHATEVRRSRADGPSRMHIHFETRADKPSVFHMTPPLVQAAHKRARLGRAVRWTVGEDLADLGWLATAQGLVTGNDIITDKVFPRKTLAEAAPKLRWIHIIGAAIEPLLPLDCLPSQWPPTNNTAVPPPKPPPLPTI